jgi:putative transposase
MARHRRFILPDVAVHIVQRGNDRQDCFRDESDYIVFLAMLRDVIRSRQCALHAYCLMTNHFHLLVTPGNTQSCGLIMRDLGRCYASYFNRRYKRTGTLWEGRFHSCLVDSPQYVLACYRYIELNPVRAGMVVSPDAYRWSSHLVNTGLATRDTLLAPHPEYLAIGSDERSRHAAYVGLFGRADDPDFLITMREATSGGYPLVGERLKAHLAANGVRLERGKPGPRIQPAKEENSSAGFDF